jgi:membrane fusion protein, multidrug efflux system
MTLKKTTIVFFGLAALLAFSSCKEETLSVNTESTIPVKAPELQPKAIQEFVTATGTAFPIRDVQLKTEQAGRYLLHAGSLTGQAFRMNDAVKKDDILISLENPEYVNQVAFDSKKLQHESAQREYTKEQGVYEKGGITIKDLADSQRAFVDATYAFDNAALALKKLEIRAPFDGVIVDLPHFTDSQWIDASTAVIRIMDYSRVYADLTLPGKEMGRLAQGQRVVVTDYSQPNTALTGVVTQISPALDAESRMFKMRIEIPNQNLRLKPGTFIKTDIVVQEKASALVIPKSIILDRRGVKVVFVVERGIALERRIQTGIENIDEAEVVTGLKASDRVVTEGFETLRVNARVKIIE